MIAANLFDLGKNLAETFELVAGKTVTYDNRDDTFKSQKGRIHLPAITYYVEDMDITQGKRRSAMLDLAVNASETIATSLLVRPVRITAKITLWSSTIAQQFELVNKYMQYLSLGASFDSYQKFETSDGVKEVKQVVNISEAMSLTVPPKGKETSDYEDKGTLYVLEGGITFDTFSVLVKENKLIRRIVTNWTTM